MTVPVCWNISARFWNTTFLKRLHRW
jgi:hypothetical protein